MVTIDLTDEEAKKYADLKPVLDFDTVRTHVPSEEFGTDSIHSGILHFPCAPPESK